MNYAIYIAAAVVMALLIGLVAMAISFLQKTLRRNIRGKTLNLLSLYDQLLEEKSQALAQEQPAAAQEPQVREEASLDLSAETVKELSAAILNTVQRSGSVPYREGAVGSLYQVIRRNFSYDISTVLPVLEQASPREEGPATALLRQLDYDTVYQLSTLPGEEQQAILSEVLQGKQKQLLEDYCAERWEFCALAFYDHLQGLSAEEPTAPRLLVSEDMARYLQGSTSPIQIVADPAICEGYQVEKNNKLYDFSIKTRELS